jgi:hypothetical protein
MNINHAHIFWTVKTSSAEINVPGLGSVNIADFISDETRNRIEQEAILALEQRLGIVCRFSQEVEK